MTKPIAKLNPEISSTHSEMERIFREGSELENQGKLDEAAIKRIDAQMRALSERLDREVADKLAEIEARYPQPNTERAAPTKLPKPLAWLFLAIVLLGFAGVTLESTVGTKY